MHGAKVAASGQGVHDGEPYLVLHARYVELEHVMGGVGFCALHRTWVGGGGFDGWFDGGDEEDGWFDGGDEEDGWFDG